MPELMPWEKPLKVQLPEAPTCIGCGRNRREILEQDGTSDFRQVAVEFGIAICWGCCRNEDHDWFAEYRAACATLWQTKREDEASGGCQSTEIPTASPTHSGDSRPPLAEDRKGHHAENHAAN